MANQGKTLLLSSLPMVTRRLGEESTWLRGCFAVRPCAKTKAKRARSNSTGLLMRLFLLVSFHRLPPMQWGRKYETVSMI